MRNLIKSELYRMLHSVTVVGVFILAILVFGLATFSVVAFKLGFYDSGISTPLNSLNLSPFILRDAELFNTFIFCPVLFCSSFNYESTSGAYRLYLLRGYNKTKFILSKMICCAIISFLLTIILFIIGTIFGLIFETKVESTTYFNGQNFNLVQALFYNFMIYLVNYLVILVIMSVFSVVGVLASHVAITFVLGSGVCAGLVGVSSTKFEFLISSVKTAFNVFDGKNSSFIVTALCMIIGLCTLTTIIFNRKDYLY
ncbi:hypothetical protein NNC19_17295 [Clostridium sp. SHJSY1]|uniref:hypothetical protein n=1 Tax=Clostridium sp. SHJSY1 TaxID=2942483 RepID=UPI0028754E7E|nr:hypothetical protein [Clostridium sp. SHJSY1]MDS0527448.1 hypothetical protein [Clostridium sp. SHJSY1]